VSRRICQLVLVIATVSFLATAFGVVLHLHLSHVDDPAHHDSAHCSICQQFLIVKNPSIVQVTAAQVQSDTVGRTVSLRPGLRAIGQTFLQQCHSRAPPA